MQLSTLNPTLMKDVDIIVLLHSHLQMQLHSLMSFLMKLDSIKLKPDVRAKMLQEENNMCAAISLKGVFYHHAILGSYNTAHIITFQDALK